MERELNHGRPSPEVSIVIPAYNATRFLAQAIDSIRSQTFDRWELIVVDDGSTDGTFDADVSMGDRRITLIRQANAGMAQARNTGYRSASSESPYLVFFDADDVWVPDALHQLHEALESDEAACAASGDDFLIDDMGQPFSGKEYWTLVRLAPGRNGKLQSLPAGSPIPFDSLIYRNSIRTPACVLIRRKAFEKVGGFRADIRIISDWIMWTELSKISSIKHLDAQVVGYRLHDHNISKRYGQIISEGRAFRRELLAQPELTAIEKVYVREGHRQDELGLARGNLGGLRRELKRGSIRGAAREVKHSFVHLVRAFLREP